MTWSANYSQVDSYTGQQLYLPTRRSSDLQQDSNTQVGKARWVAVAGTTYQLKMANNQCDCRWEEHTAGLQSHQERVCWPLQDTQQQQDVETVDRRDSVTFTVGTTSGTPAT